ncbi:MAG TPA: hypothetical protein ENJ04_01845 [Nitrospirae bacterium]|nr:hypothetical protein [Nitrospirota bacterium]
MCMEYASSCVCGLREASFNFKDDVMTGDVILRLYCPNCSTDIAFTPQRMIADNGWIIEYDMEVAEFLARKLPAKLRERLSPEVLFDEGYATWRGVYPGDHIDSKKEREEIAKLAKTDPKAYIEKLKTWGVERMKRLRESGWRKAREE